MKARSWNQAICYYCWYATQTRQPPAAESPADREQCCECGRITYDGIYVQRSPHHVNFPRYEEDQ